jgi:hypothetical protein
LQASKETLAKATDDATEHVVRIGALAEASAKESSAALQATQQRSEHLSDMLKRIEEAVAQLPMLGKVELPSERLERQFGSFTQQVEQLTTDLGNAMDEYRRRRQKRRRWYWPFRG